MILAIWSKDPDDQPPKWSIVPGESHYITAFSDGAFSTFVGDLIVRPDARLKYLGLDLLRLVEETYPGVPVFLRPFDNAHQVFFEHAGADRNQLRPETSCRIVAMGRNSRSRRSLNGAKP